jgi:hypothetical protein
MGALVCFDARGSHFTHEVSYSYRNAVVGSPRAAREAGR